MNPNPCLNNGVCQPIGSLGMYICKCNPQCNQSFNCAVCSNQTTPFPATTSTQYQINTPNIIQLNVTFNSTFNNDFSNINSVASLNFTQNFKSFVSFYYFFQ